MKVKKEPWCIEYSDCSRLAESRQSEDPHCSNSECNANVVNVSIKLGKRKVVKKQKGGDTYV